MSEESEVIYVTDLARMLGRTEGNSPGRKVVAQGFQNGH